MRKQFFFLLLVITSFQLCNAQMSKLDSLHAKKDSTLRATMMADIKKMHEDSVKVNKDYDGQEKWEKIFARLEFPQLKGGKLSGVVPVKDPSFVPDPTLDYKILFELAAGNPDSTAKEINDGLNEIARVINLHVASGIPIKKIMPVIVVHGSALNALKNNEAYQKRFKTDNPNIKLMGELEKLGASFIACGQAMAFFEVDRKEFLPEIKVSLTAQTVISCYQLKGYILHELQ